jgi:hypothetical protein
MTNQLPPDPRSSRRGALSFDEWIAVLVAFPIIGIILWWGMSRDGAWFDRADSGPSQSASEPDSTGTGLFSIFGDGIDTDDEVSEEPSTIDEHGVDEQEPAPLVPPFLTQRDAETSAQTDDATTLSRPFGRILREPSEPESLPSPAVTSPEPESASPTPLVPSPSVTSPAATLSPTPTPTATPSPPAISFPDVPQTYWASAFITGLAGQNRLRGLPDGSFEPNQPVTRAQFAAQIEQAFDQPQGSVDQTFSDVTADYWAYSAIGQATQMGFMSGYPDGAFRPQQPITRLEVLLSLVTGLGITTPETQAALSTFADRAQIPEWATPKIAAATEAGLVVSHPNVQMLNPNQPTTRAEAAAMIYQALVANGEAEPVSSDYIARP